MDSRSWHRSMLSRNYGSNSNEINLISGISMKTSLVDLNEQCLFNIFDCLSYDELFAVADVSKALLRAVERYMVREYRRQDII